MGMLQMIKQQYKSEYNQNVINVITLPNGDLHFL